MTIIEHRVAQGSEEWKLLRAGCLTASEFVIMRERMSYGPNKGQPTAKARALAFRKAVERISRTPLNEGHTTWAMERGHELEPKARAKHEELVADMVREVGFVCTDDGWFGASADGFLGDEGCEYKCFVDPDKLRSILIDDDLSDVMDQVQGGMWLTGARRWHTGLYCPALESIGLDFRLIVVERDEAYIEALESDLLEFKAMVETYEARLRAKAAAISASTAPTRIVTPADMKADIFA